MGIADAIAAKLIITFSIVILLVAFGIGLFLGWLIWG